MLERKRILVTGGAGFIGSHLAENLCANNDVVVLDDLSTGLEENISGFKGDVVFIKGDVRDDDVLGEAVRDANFVFHCAAQVSVERSVDNPVETNQINVEGTRKLLNRCKEAEVERLVFVSSSSVYGSDPELPKREDMPLRPESPYAASKIMGEQHCRLYGKQYDLPIVILRLFNVYGPRQNASSPYASVIPRFISAILHDQKPTVFGDGKQTRDFVFIDDVVNALVRAATTKEARGETLNIASGESTSILDLLGVLGGIFDRRIDPRFTGERPGDIRHSVADITKAKSVLGFVPEVELADGLRNVVDHSRTLL
ncbi:MAG: SDR family oxidoreductase [Thermoplasmata archaeon]